MAFRTREVLEHMKQRRKELADNIEFLRRDSVEFWENSGAGRVDIKPRMVESSRRAIEQYDKIIADLEGQETTG
jgi:hypothetical protein